MTSPRRRVGRRLPGGGAMRFAVAILGASSLLALRVPTVMAVDRSKFRTCQQTSFCRRHRGGKSKDLYGYKLVPESVRFHSHPSAESSSGTGSGEDGGSGDTDPNSDAGSGSRSRSGGEGLLSKISRRIMDMGSSGSAESGNSGSVPVTDPDYDPYVRGPPPFVTARLVNVAPLTSTGLTARTYGGGSSSPPDATVPTEELRLSIHFHSDGVARMRVAEVLDVAAGGSGGDNGNHNGASSSSVRSTPRWTSDELVLNVDEMEGVDPSDVTVMSVHPSIEVGGNGVSEQQEEQKKKKEAAVSEREIIDLISRAGLGGESVQSASAENFVAFSYGGGYKLMLRIEPFAAFLFDDADARKRGPPIVAVGADGLMHFEVRRSKDGTAGGGGGPTKRKLTEKNEKKKKKAVPDFDEDGDTFSLDGEDDYEEVEEEEMEGGEDKEDRHGGKEIVGYWEDGLAIYADGTREEKDENGETAEHETDKSEGSESRRLDEDSEEYDTAGMWEESFSSHKDTKPHGPQSVGIDVTFPSSSHLFGLPEHASSTQLRTTAGKNKHYEEPYRLYNLDVFEYELDETMALYGHVPLVVSQSAEAGTAGVFWFNPTETFVDVEEIHKEDPATSPSSRTHFVSESGIFDLFFIPGPTPAALYERYARLTGRMPLPPMFSLGYHQCRWNYRDQADVYQVHSKFEELDYPYDVLWLDIEHTDGKRYFTWDDKLFPHPKEMQERLAKDGRRMVTIVDPHIKRDNGYYIHKEATALGYYIKDKDGEKDYDGWCWPGSSSYLDFTSSEVRSWWAQQFGYDRYVGSTPELFTWNDMNEPSVFNGPEVSMQKDLQNLAGFEHREWHNLYGMLFHRATSEGLVSRNDGANVRPFVLSRSFFAGSQRYGAIWTGDNLAKWSHLEVAAPMLLGLNVAALSFVGADVGGFFGDPDAELMTRWMQAGAYQPFFRGHAHHDSKRREPWMFDDATLVRLRHAAMARYALLPYWYTVFWQAGTTGMPVMRTMWMQYPEIPELFSVDNQYLIGSDLLVKPVTAPGVTVTEVLFPSSDAWYDVDTMQRVPVSVGERKAVVAKTVDSGINKIPVYQRGGSIVPRKLRLRRSSHLMLDDPYTLYVALGDDDTKAEGTLYLDDETTFDHERKGHYATATFRVDWNAGTITNAVVAGSDVPFNTEIKRARMVERIVVMGVSDAPSAIEVSSGAAADSVLLEFEYDGPSRVLVIRKPQISALEEWSMRLFK